MKRLLLTIMLIALVVVSFGCDKKPDEVEPEIIPASQKIDVSKLTLLDEYKYDFDKDGFEENIGMYTAAGRTPDGEIAWDDGQRWVLVVQDDEKDYILFDNYVQLGGIDFYVFEELEEGKFFINTIQVGTANFTLKTYDYNSEKDQFELTIPYDTTGNISFVYGSK